MIVDENFKRRVRIQGNIDETRGFMMSIYDIDSGEAITNVAKAVIYLDPREVNKVQLTYHKADPETKHFLKGGENQTLVLDNPEIYVTAYEVDNG